MSTINRTYGEKTRYANTGDIRDPWKDRRFIPSKRVVADTCWCGTMKHVEWPVCSTCRVILEKDVKP